MSYVTIYQSLYNDHIYSVRCQMRLIITATKNRSICKVIQISYMEIVYS